MTRNIWAGLALAFWVTNASPAVAAGGSAKKLSAKEQADWEALKKSGRAHFEIAEYEQALSDFKAAYLLKSDPGLLFNIAVCQHRLKRFDEAEATYKLLLAQQGDDPELRKNIQAALDQIASDRSAARAPSERPTEPEPEQEPKRTTPEPAQSASQPTPLPNKTNPALTPDESPRVSTRTKLIGGASLAALALGGGFGIFAQRSLQSAQDAGAGDVFALDEESSALFQQAKTRAFVADLSFGVGIAGAITTSIFFVKDRRASLALLPGAPVSLALRF